MLFRALLLLFSFGVIKGNSGIQCNANNHFMNGTCVIENLSSDNFSLKLSLNFSDKHSITGLIFVNSVLANVAPNFLEGFKNVILLDMANCYIGSISSEAFYASAANLLTLNMSNNNIFELNRFQFNGANNLINIDLSHNLINKIDKDAFRKLRKLEIIDLSFNDIQFLHNKTFAWSSLVKINLNNNKLQILQFTLTKCQALYVDNNLLRSDNVSITNMTNLKYLTLRNNSLTHSKFLEDLTNLTQVVLSNNQLYEVKFSEIPENIEILDLSNNNLSSIEVNALWKLEQLYLSGNKLGKQNFDELSNACPSLNLMDISDNDWMCDRLNAALTLFMQLKIKVHTAESKQEFNVLNIKGIVCKIENLPIRLSRNDQNYS